jgi:CPA1 family monovalent cation:H+ antiporter
MLRKNAKLELLRGVPLFERLSKRELEAVAALADEVQLPEGRRLTEEGASGTEFVVIVDGAADVRRRGRKINALASGDFLGEIALVTGSPRTATVTTTAPTTVLVITARGFRTLLRTTPSVQLKVLEALAARLPDE